MTSDIFISYSRKDTEAAKALVERLRAGGVSVWMDQSSIEGSETWSAEIVAAIKNCKLFVVLLSEFSIESHNVTKEVLLASERRIKILPIDLAPCELSDAMEYALAGIHRIPFDNEDLMMRTFSKLGIGADENSPSTGPSLLGLQYSSVKRLAVLPFEDLSPSHDNEWFSDGMTDELIATLGSLSELQVTTRTSVMDYKKNRPKISVIADELNVKYIVDGSVRKSGDKIRIYASLTDAKTNLPLWHDKYDGTFDDIFDLQESVSKQIAEALKLKLAPHEEKRLEKRLTDNADAYEIFLQANNYRRRNTKQDYHYAIDLFLSAIAIDPDFAMAHAMLSECYCSLYHTYERQADLLERAEQSARKAIDCDIALPAAYSTLGLIEILKGNREEAMRTCKLALDLDPKDSEALFRLGFINADLGEHLEASHFYEATLEVNPKSLVAHYNLAREYDLLNQVEDRKRASQKAIPYYERHLSTHPDDQTKRIYYAYLLEYDDRDEESQTEIEKLITMPNVDGYTLYDAACILTRQGKRESGIEILGRAIESGFAHVELMRTDPDLEALREIPSYAALLEKISFTL